VIDISVEERKALILNAALLLRLEQLVHLTDKDRSAFLAAMEPVRKAPPNRDLNRYGEHPTGVRFIQAGFACRQIGLPDGRRQILGLLLPGDICDACSLPAPAMDHSICALTTVIFSEMSRASLANLVEARPRIGEALWRSALVNEAMLYERITSLGQRSAKERLAHFLCEVFVRNRAVGLTTGMQCNLPLSQSDLADTLGLSLVHTNRSLQALRADGLIRLESRLLTIIDFDRLQEKAHFNPKYLHFDRDIEDVALPINLIAVTNRYQQDRAFSMP